MRNNQPDTPGRRAALAEKENRLNEAAARSKEKGLPDGERETLRNEVFLLAFELYDDASNVFLDALLEACEKYDAEKGPFSHYLKYLLSRRNTDAYRKQQRHAPDADSLDAAFSDDNSLTLGEVIPDQSASDPGQINRLDGKLADLTAQILNFAERHTGKAANETRRCWFRMFYTEDMTLVSKEGRPTLLHERDVFSAMELDYLDYYMLHPCREMVELAMTPLKPYHDVVPARQSMEETPLPLQADVSIAFWDVCRGEKKGPSARTEQYKVYKAELEQI